MQMHEDRDYRQRGQDEDDQLGRPSVSEEGHQRAVLVAGRVGHHACGDGELGYRAAFQHRGGGAAECHWGWGGGTEGAEVGSSGERCVEYGGRL